MPIGSLGAVRAESDAASEKASGGRPENEPRLIHFASVVEARAQQQEETLRGSVHLPSEPDVIAEEERGSGASVDLDHSELEQEFSSQQGASPQDVGTLQETTAATPSAASAAGAHEPTTDDSNSAVHASRASRASSQWSRARDAVMERTERCGGGHHMRAIFGAKLATFDSQAHSKLLLKRVYCCVLVALTRRGVTWRTCIH